MTQDCKYALLTYALKILGSYFDCVAMFRNNFYFLDLRRQRKRICWKEQYDDMEIDEIVKTIVSNQPARESDLSKYDF